MTQDIDTEISRSIISMLLSEPFFAHLLSTIVRRTTDTIDTAAVYAAGSRIELLVNPGFFLDELQNQQERIAVIKHETLHLLFKHLFRFEKGRHHSIIYNIACDVVVNQYIGPKWKLPATAVTLSSFPDLKMEEEKDVEYYYRHLYSLYEEMKMKVDGYDEYSTDCDYDFKNTSAPKSAKAMHGLIANGWKGDHLFDKVDLSDSALGESELDRIIEQTKERSGQKGWGLLPGNLQQMIMSIVESRKPQVDWKRVIRLFSASSKRTRIKHTIKRESKRYGTRPGIKIKRFQKMAVVIDTSGSINSREFAAFFHEVHGMWKEGAEISIIECDAKVQRVYEYKGKTPETVAGRGGTSFDPPFEYLCENRSVKYDGCIYLTDGEAPAPTIKPNCKLLWVVTSIGNIGDHLLWGRSIQIKE